MPGSPVLLGSYASRLLPWVAGFLSSCHPSGCASLVLQYMRGLGELLRTSGGRVFCLIARLSPGLSLALAFWVIHVWVFSDSPSGSGCSVL